jgi:hypothetical protein
MFLLDQIAVTARTTASWPDNNKTTLRINQGFSGEQWIGRKAARAGGPR